MKLSPRADMRSHSSQCAVRCLLGALALTVCRWPSASGQAAPEPGGRPAVATLPQSNEAALLSGRVREAIRSGNYRLAIHLIERMMELPGGLVRVPGTRTHHPVQRHAAYLLRELPADGAELYRQIYDARVNARFQRAARVADVAALRELFQTYPLSSAWSAVGGELAGHLLERGAYAEAAEVVREVLAATGTDASPGLRAQLVVALAKTGAWPAADLALTRLKTSLAAGADATWPDRVERLARWLDASRRGAGAQTGLRDAFHLPRASPWSQPLVRGDGAGDSDRETDLALAIAALRRLPLYEPVLESGVLVARLRGTLWAFDALTLTPLWHQREIEPPDASARLPGGWLPAPEARAGEAAGGARIVAPGARGALLYPLRHAVAVAFGRVFTIEGLSPQAVAQESFGRWTIRNAADQVAPNELVARALRTGALLWRSGADPAHPLFGVAFQDRPVAVGQALVVPFVRGSDLNLAVLEPSGGRLLREVPVVGPPTRFTGVGGRCRVVVDETTVYVCTGNGVVAAFDREGLAWKWAAVYPSSLGEHLSRVWWQAEDPLPESGVDRPLIAGDLLVVAPVDSRQIFALDRFTGGERWRVPRAGAAFVVGALDGGLVVGGYALASVDLADGRTVRWETVPLEVTGRPVIKGRQIFVPTRNGIVTVDGRTGKITADQAFPASDQVVAASRPGTGRAAALDPVVPESRVVSANLVVSPAALFAVTPGRVVKYPDIRAARRLCERMLSANPADERAGLALAWLDLFAGNFEAALAALETMTLRDPARIADRDRLLGHLCVALARQTQAAPRKLAWLRRAARLADSLDAGAYLAMQIGQALEASGARRAALEHYAALLTRAESGYVRMTDDRGRRVAVWLAAVERIRALLPGVAAAEAEVLLDGLVRSATSPEQSATVMLRARLAVADPARRRKIDQALSIHGLPPELAIRFLPAGADATLPALQRRRLHLNRWDTHVALGLMEEARADQAYWEEHYARASPPAEVSEGSPQLSSAAEQTRVARISLAMRKLEQAAGAPFARPFRRQWLLRDAELVLDARHPVQAMRAWLPVRHLQDRQLVLHSAVTGMPLRKTLDAIVRAARPAGGRALRPEAAYGRSVAWGGTPRKTWPAVWDGYLAAVPVRGGLVCIGLGPERAGGRRFWEYAVPEWGDIPDAFNERAAPTPLGICFAPRGDRVVLVGWADGRLHWQRDLPGVRIQRVLRVGPSVVVMGRDQEMLAFDAMSGARLRSPPAELGTVQSIEVVADTLLAWGEDWVAALDCETFTPRWRRRCAGATARVIVPERGWVACRAPDSARWEILDARSGEPASAGGLPGLTDITALVAEGDTLYVAGWHGGDDERGIPSTVQVLALDVAGGPPLWTRSFETTVPLNRTQLLAHREFIPVLLLGADARPSDVIDLRTLAIQLLEKRTGRVHDAVSIAAHFRPVDAWCDVYLLATPTRMIVQAAGNVVAFGNSPLGGQRP